MSGGIPPLSAPVIDREHKVREAELEHGQQTKKFTFSPEHVAASIAPVCNSSSRIGTLGYNKRYVEFSAKLKQMKPKEPIRTGNPEVDVPNLERYSKKLDEFQKLETRACEIFQNNLKYRNYPSRQFTLSDVGGGGNSPKRRNRNFDSLDPFTLSPKSCNQVFDFSDP